MKSQNIVRNSARCLLCCDEVESKHRHDFMRYSCGNVAVDGGQAYFRRVSGGDEQAATWIDTSIFESDDPIAFALEAILRAQDGIGPAGDELEDAAVIDNWLFILMRDGLSIKGTIAGHPKIGRTRYYLSAACRRHR